MTVTAQTGDRAKGCGGGQGSGRGPEGWIRIVETAMNPPSLKDNRADLDRLLAAVEKGLGSGRVAVQFRQIGRLASLLRRYGYRGYGLVYQGSQGWRLIDLLPPGDRPRVYGLAVDLGSSTVVLRLLDLLTAEVQAERSFVNPQTGIGADILSRIHYASEEQGLAELQSLVLRAMNREIGGLTRERGIQAGDIVAAAVAGNTTMTHLFLGLDPYGLCREPYIPVVNRPELIRAGELGLEIHAEGPVMVLPNVGSYFGGDLMAGILATGISGSEEPSLLLDVGTNAEVVLGNREWLVACAGAAGPALEGGVAAMGMMAGPGVIDRVRVDADSGAIETRTIEDLPPVGICGSGLIDLVAQLFLAGMIDLRGKYVPARCGGRLREVHGMRHFVVVPSRGSGTGEDLCLSQADIDALIRSKAAMYTILETVTEMLQISFQEIARFFVAGTFGSYIDPRSAIVLGMIPDLPLQTYEARGNTSLEGACRALTSGRAREEIDRIRDRITYIELNVNQAFMNRFNAAKFIPHTERALFPSVGSWKGRG